MNKRIRELAEQAGINIDSFQFSGIPIKHIVDELSLEKFAELIVKETLEVARAGVEFGDGMESAVEQYFGVKL